MRRLSKTDLRRRRGIPPVPSPAPASGTTPAEEAVLLGGTDQGLNDGGEKDIRAKSRQTAPLSRHREGSEGNR